MYTCCVSLSSARNVCGGRGGQEQRVQARLVSVLQVGCAQDRTPGVDEVRDEYERGVESREIVSVITNESVQV